MSILFVTVDILKPGVDLLTLRHLVEVGLTLFLGDCLAIKGTLIDFTIDFKDEEFPELLAVLEGIDNMLVGGATGRAAELEVRVAVLLARRRHLVGVLHINETNLAVLAEEDGTVLIYTVT